MPTFPLSSRLKFRERGVKTPLPKITKGDIMKIILAFFIGIILERTGLIKKAEVALAKLIIKIQNKK